MYRLYFSASTAFTDTHELVYDELRRLATSKMSDERPDQTLQATDLVHEAFVRLVDVNNAQQWNSRGHFFAAAAEAMRRILVENARRRRQLKRGVGFHKAEIHEIIVVADNIQEDLIDLDEALTKLTAIDPQAARLIQLRYFVGLSIPDAAKVLGISPRTVDRVWALEAQKVAGTELGKIGANQLLEFAEGKLACFRTKGEPRCGPDCTFIRVQNPVHNLLQSVTNYYTM